MVRTPGKEIKAFAKAFFSGKSRKMYVKETTTCGKLQAFFWGGGVLKAKRKQNAGRLWVGGSRKREKSRKKIRKKRGKGGGKNGGKIEKAEKQRENIEKYTEQVNEVSTHDTHS